MVAEYMKWDLNQISWVILKGDSKGVHDGVRLMVPSGILVGFYQIFGLFFEFPFLTEYLYTTNKKIYQKNLPYF